jgi:hypothetical protein
MPGDKPTLIARLVSEFPRSPRADFWTWLKKRTGSGGSMSVRNKRAVFDDLDTIDTILD